MMSLRDHKAKNDGLQPGEVLPGKPQNSKAQAAAGSGVRLWPLSLPHSGPREGGTGFTGGPLGGLREW